MAIKLSKPAATGTVTQTMKDKGNTVSESTKEEVVQTPVEPTAQPLCEVDFSLRYTHNLGNYQSFQVGVGLKVPCPTEQIDEAFEYANKWVEQKLEETLKEKGIEIGG